MRWEFRLPVLFGGMEQRVGVALVAAHAVGAGVVWLARRTWFPRKPRLQLRDATVVVTGASSGIGAAVATQLASERGAHVVLLARNEANLRRVAAKINATNNGSAEVIACDCADARQVEAAAATVLAPSKKNEPPRVAAIVHCAGAGRWRFLTEAPAEDIDFCMAAPFFAAAYVTRAFLPAMLRADPTPSALVFVQSPAGVAPLVGATAYGCARYALQGLFECLDADCHGSPVRPQLVVLGETATEYRARRVAPGAPDRVPRFARSVIRPILTPEEAARSVVTALTAGTRVAYAPVSLRLVAALYAWCPSLVRCLLRRTASVNYHTMLQCG